MTESVSEISEMIVQGNTEPITDWLNEVISEGALPDEMQRAKVLLEKLAEYKPLAKIEEMEEQNYNMIDNVLNNMPPKKEPYLEYFAAECDEFHDMGAYEKSTDVNQIAAVYEKYRENPENAYRVCSMGIIYRDPEDSYYDDAEFAIVKRKYSTWKSDGRCSILWRTCTDTGRD